MKDDVKKSLPVVAVTGLHRGDNPQPGAAVVRSMRRVHPDLRVVGLSYDPLESGLYSQDIDRVDEAFMLPFPFKGPEALLERLVAIHRAVPFDALVPCLDSEIDNLIAIAPKLKSLGVRAILPTQKSLDDRAKARLDAFCKRHRVPAPRTLAADEPAKLVAFAEKIGYPLYVKGRFYEASLVYTPAQLIEAFERISARWGAPVMAQEALVGEEYDIVGLGDGEGGVVGHCAIKKMLRTAAGKGFAGIVVDDPALTKTARAIIKALKWRGPFELEFVKPLGRPHALLEMNPRFPAWVDFPAQIGCNLPARLVDMLCGRAPAALPPCEPGQMFLRHCLDIVGDLSKLARISIEGALNPHPSFETVEQEP